METKLQSFKDLIVWQKVMLLVSEIYKTVHLLPKFELYIPGSQMIRAVISIPSNIAEGYRRKNRGKYIQFLSIAFASAGELETQILIAKNQYPTVNIGKVIGLVEEIQKMLYVIKTQLK